MNVSFIKMHGAGNDFVILDARARAIDLSPQQIRHIADRHRGIGCDQMVVMESSQPSPFGRGGSAAEGEGSFHPQAGPHPGPLPEGEGELFMRIYNADGGMVASCGNASRCVAWLRMQETGAKTARIETAAGVIEAVDAGECRVTVDMGEPRLTWQEIPLSHACDTLHVPLSHGPLVDPVAVSMGNPHAVFFVPDTAEIPLENLGPALENHEIFPEKANISLAAVQKDGTIALRVWERGVGLTLACGTAACATLVAAHLRGLTGRAADIILPGGALHIEWAENNHVLMTGPVAVSFKGTLEL